MQIFIDKVWSILGKILDNHWKKKQVSLKTDNVTILLIKVCIVSQDALERLGLTANIQT